MAATVSGYSGDMLAHIDLEYELTCGQLLHIAPLSIIWCCSFSWSHCHLSCDIIAFNRMRKTANWIRRHFLNQFRFNVWKLNTYLLTYVCFTFTTRPWIGEQMDTLVDLPFFSCLPLYRLVLFIFPPQDEFYQQLQAIRQPWHIPSDTDSDILEPPEQDKSE